MKKYFWMVAVGVIVSVLNARAARAEGGDKAWGSAHGVNRVVRAQDKTLINSIHANMSFVIPVDKDGNVTSILNPYADKPTVYLGGKGDGIVHHVTGDEYYIGDHPEIDAGLQFYTGGVRGWGAFISVAGGAGHGKYVNPQYWDPDQGVSLPWRGGGVNVDTDHDGKVDYTSPWNDGAGTIIFGQAAISCTLTLDVSDGNVKLSVTGADPNLGTFYWNPDPNPTVAKATSGGSAPAVPVKLLSNTGMPPKYVVGMTRPYPYNHELDGSKITCILSSSSLGGMSIDQQTTGYDAPGNGSGIHKLIDVPLSAWDAIWTSDGETIKAPNAATIVEFPDGNNFNNRQGTTENPENQGSAARYSGEQININLRRACRPIGKKIEW